MSFFKRIYGVIVRPRSTFREISNAPSVWQGIIALVGMSVISTLLIFNKNYFIKVFGTGATFLKLNTILKMMPVIIALGVFATMILTPIFHFVSVSILNLLCEFFGYSGNGKGLFTTLAFASIPSLISSIIFAILVAVDLQQISIIFTIGISIWMIVLKIFAIKETYSMSGGKATLIYFIPIITIITVIVLFTLSITMSIIPIINTQL
ncbi:YIP1 family protein [Caldisalinibacter kiritimatiensis]|uniref:Yip1 domain-containing protein n=1 Tax=Caldisalinibacter kiritimatiensis TaxID=1304284 RepID=R1AVA5_9FIRM|nr:YIP1 family protein [Caldisalinibacter kiritimatiensis]EOD00577.1 hypothetical protein L21TH_1377 [Caldisalinibacter kiritimatiensis]